MFQLLSSFLQFGLSLLAGVYDSKVSRILSLSNPPFGVWRRCLVVQSSSLPSPLKIIHQLPILVLTSIILGCNTLTFFFLTGNLTMRNLFAGPGHEPLSNAYSPLTCPKRINPPR